MDLRAYLSRAFLLQNKTLALLMIFFIPGTLFGFYWYKDQLVETWNGHPHWQLPFVPDSPMASMFFVIATLWLWIRPQPQRSPFWGAVRSLAEALAVVTSVKYGVWATAIIFIGAALGDPLEGEHWMLVISHLSMAFFALLFARFYHFKPWALVVAAGWTFLNDAIDYGFDVYPYLSDSLMNKLVSVAVFTFVLTLCSVIAAGVARYAPDRSQLQERATA